MKRNNGLVCVLGLLLSGLAASSALAAGTWYVSTNGVDTGSSGPFASINYALKQITSGDTIIVSNGTYTLTNTCNLGTNVTITGSTTNPADVIVDGNSLWRCFAISTNASIQNLTIQHGSLTNSAVYITGGTTATLYNCLVQSNITTNGAVSTVQCSARGCVLNYCTFSNNLVTTNAPAVAGGSGVFYFTSQTSAGNYLITNCTFVGNINSNINAGWGCAVLVFAQRDAPSVFTLFGSSFIGNGSTNLVGGAPIVNSYALSYYNAKFNIVSNTFAATTNNGSILSLSSSNSVLVSGCVFSNLYTSAGAPGLNIGAPGSISSGILVSGPNIISNCMFSGNYGVASSPCFVNNSASGLVVSCTFTGNYANGQNNVAGGGLCINGAGTVSNCLFVGNGCGGGASYGNGGGLALYANSNAKNNIGPRVVSNCIFSNNACSAYGGGLCTFSNALIQNCVFIGNSATNGSGGGIYVSGSASGDTLNVPIIRNCLIAGNAAKNYGGGVDVSYSALSSGNNGNGYAILDNCTIVNNTNATAKYGSGIACATNYLYMTNCIVWSNCCAGVWTNSIYIYAGANTATLQNCCLSDTNIWTAGSAIIASGCSVTLDPKFVTPSTACGTNLLLGAYDFHLQKISPCHDTGINEAWMTGATDLNGYLRILGKSVDIGCYEYKSPPSAGSGVFFR